MHKFLDGLSELLNNFEMELSKIRSIWRQIEADNPDFEQVSEENWQKKQARMWLHGGTSVHDCNRLERWLVDSPSLSKTAQISAMQVYRKWKKSLETKGEYGAYYLEFREFQIAKPKKDELLIYFVTRLALLVEEDGKGHRLGWRALKSFLDYIRTSYPTEEVAFVEHIFPKKMDTHFGKIIRIIPSEAYPIPEKIASELLIELAHRCRNYRRLDARHTAAESLGLCWLCIIASRLRLPVHVESIMAIQSEAIQIGIGHDFFPILQIPTWFGDRPVETSHLVSKFLRGLSLVPSTKPRRSIFQRPLRSLTRMLKEALQSVSPSPEYGNITYLSLLNRPHIFGDYRYQPK